MEWMSPSPLGSGKRGCTGWSASLPDHGSRCGGGGKDPCLSPRHALQAARGQSGTRDPLLIPSTEIQTRHHFSAQRGTARGDSPCLHKHTPTRGRDLGTETHMHDTTSKGHGLAMESYRSRRKSLDPHHRLQKHGARMNLSFSKT